MVRTLTSSFLVALLRVEMLIEVSRGKGLVARDKGLVEQSVELKITSVGRADRDSR